MGVSRDVCKIESAAEVGGFRRVSGSFGMGVAGCFCHGLSSDFEMMAIGDGKWGEDMFA